MPKGPKDWSPKSDGMKVYFVIDGEDGEPYGPYYMVEYIHGELVCWKRPDRRFVLAGYDPTVGLWVLGEDARKSEHGKVADYFQVWNEFDHE